MTMPSPWSPPEAQRPTTTLLSIRDPSLAHNVGPVSLSSMAGGFPQLAQGSRAAQPSLAERIPLMYAIPPREDDVRAEQGRVAFPGSNDSVRSQASQGSEETVSPNQDGTFSYGVASEPVGSDIEPLIREQTAKFYQNLDQANVSAAVADTA